MQQLRKNVRKVFIAGSAGALEGIYYHSVRPVEVAALLVHSSPKEYENTRYNGNMNERVMKYLFYVCKLRQISVLRFNLRGVGNSEGVFQDLQHGMEDASVCFDWLQECNPNAKKFWLMGYSSGSWIAAQIAMRRPTTSGFVCVRPKAGKSDFGFLAPLSPGLMIHAGRDSMLRSSQIEALKGLTKKKCKDTVEHFTIPEADETFKEDTRDLVKKVDKFLDTHGAGIQPVVRIR